MVPKQPQSIFNPLAKLIEIAIMNTKSNPLRIAEFSFTDIPNTRSIPAQSSIHGKIIARILIKKIGRSL